MLTALIHPQTCESLRGLIARRETFTVKLGAFQLRGGMETYNGNFTPHIDDYDPLDPTEPTGTGYALFLSGSRLPRQAVNEVIDGLLGSGWQASAMRRWAGEGGQPYFDQDIWVFWQEVTA